MVAPKKRQHKENVTLKNSRRMVATDEVPVVPHGSSNTATTDLATSASTQLQPITEDGTRPQKRFYRQRAHCNPLAHNDSYDYPITPLDMDWNRTSNLYPAASSDGAVSYQGRSTAQERHAQQPTVLDIGCGFGGLTLALASILPHRNILGIEIRAKVTEYVRLRILAARKEKSYGINPHAIENSIPPPPSSTTTTTTSTISLPAIPMSRSLASSEALVVPPQQPQQHHYNNCGVIRTNSMKYGPNYFTPHSIFKLFFCFPDPHFKRKNFPRRIVSYRLLDEYAYMLQKKRGDAEQNDHAGNDNDDDNDDDDDSAGLLYAITDVKELHEWHVQVCQSHPLFEPVLMSESSSENNNVEEDRDPCIYAMKYLTEEGQKVDRNGGSKYYIIYQCHHRPKEEAPMVHAGNFFRS